MLYPSCLLKVIAALSDRAHPKSSWVSASIEDAWIKDYISSWNPRESLRELILDHVHTVGMSITLLVLYQITLQTLSF